MHANKAPQKKYFHSCLHVYPNYTFQMNGVPSQPVRPVSSGNRMKGITEKPVASAHRAQRREHARKQLQELRADWNKPSRKSLTRSGGNTNSHNRSLRQCAIFRVCSGRVNY